MERFIAVIAAAAVFGNKNGDDDDAVAANEYMNKRERNDKKIQEPKQSRSAVKHTQFSIDTFKICIQWSI